MYMYMDNSIFKENGIVARDGTKVFIVYATLLKITNKANFVYTSIRMIRDCAGFNKSDKSKIVNSLKLLNSEGFIKIVGEVPEDINDFFSIYMPQLSTSSTKVSYTKLYIKDYDLIYKMGYGVYTLYCFLCKYYNREKGYSYPSFKRMVTETGFSTATCSKYINLFHNLEIIRVEQGSNLKNNNNKYFLNPDTLNEILRMSMDQFNLRMEQIKKEFNQFYVNSDSKSEETINVEADVINDFMSCFKGYSEGYHANIGF